MGRHWRARRSTCTSPMHARRPDGFHAPDQSCQTIELADTLTIVEHDGPLTLRCPGQRRARGRLQPGGARGAGPGLRTGAAGAGGAARDARQADAGARPGWAAAAPSDGRARLLCADVGRAIRDLLARVGVRLGSTPCFDLGRTALGTGRGDDQLRCRRCRPSRRSPPAVRRVDGRAYSWVASSRRREAALEAPFDPPARSRRVARTPRRLPQRLRPGRGGRHPEIRQAVGMCVPAGARLAIVVGQRISR